MKQKDTTLSNKTDRHGSSPISFLETDRWTQVDTDTHRVSQHTTLFASSNTQLHPETIVTSFAMKCVLEGVTIQSNFERPPTFKSISKQV